MESGTLIGMTKLVMGEVRVKVEYHVNGQIGERSIPCKFCKILQLKMFSVVLFDNSRELC